MTSGELAIARADPLGLVGVRGPGDLDPADPRRPLAVGDDLERELQQDGVEQAPRQRPRRRRRVAWSSTVSLVLICPSTVIRSKEPATAERSAASGIGDLGVGLDEAEHGREARLDHPGALGLGGDGDPAGADACSASGPRSVVMIASREVARRRRADSALGRLAARRS